MLYDIIWHLIWSDMMWAGGLKFYPALSSPQRSALGKVALNIRVIRPWGAASVVPGDRRWSLLWHIWPGFVGSFLVLSCWIYRYTHTKYTHTKYLDHRIVEGSFFTFMWMDLLRFDDQNAVTVIATSTGAHCLGNQAATSQCGEKNPEQWPFRKAELLRTQSKTPRNVYGILACIQLPPK